MGRILDTILLAHARTPFERKAIDDWAAREHPDVPVAHTPEELQDLEPGTKVVPVRVTWLPPQSRRVSGFADLVALANPRTVPARSQARVVRRAPERLRIVVAEGATIADLRARYAERTDGSEPFPTFVAGQAALACERAVLALIGDRYKVPRLVTEQITSSATFRAKVRALAEELGRPEGAVLQEATDRLNDFVAVQSRVALDIFTGVFKNLHDRAWDVSVDQDTLEQLRLLNKQHGLVFLPAHRSYLDTMVLAQVLRENDFPANHILGGANLAFWPMGPLGRRAGIIFIRRNFGDDPVYKLAMRSYLAFLVGKRFNLEWYLEGGRSRTGKLRPPMLGLLAYVVGALDEQPDTDVMVVPVSIVYDQLSEVTAMAQEATGGTKKAESLTWLLNYARSQRTHLGEARVRFGAPFSLRSALNEAGEGSIRLEKVAFRVLDGINAATPISSTSLAAFALLGAGDRAFTQVEIEAIVAPLVDYIERRALPGPEPALLRGDGLVKTLGQLTKVGVLDRYDGGVETIWSVAPGNHAVAGYYRNGATHHLVNRAIVELVALWVAESRGSRRRFSAKALEAESMRIRDLLKFEFFFPDKARFRAELIDEIDLLIPDRGRSEITPALAAAALAGAGVLVARRTLQPFLDAQRVVADRLVALGDGAVDQEAFMTQCLGVGEQMLRQGTVLSPDSVSKELYAAALKLAANRELVEAGADLAGRRAAFLAEVTELWGRLARIAEFEAAHTTGGSHS